MFLIISKRGHSSNHHCGPGQHRILAQDTDRDPGFVGEPVRSRPTDGWPQANVRQPIGQRQGCYKIVLVESKSSRLLIARSVRGCKLSIPCLLAAFKYSTRVFGGKNTTGGQRQTPPLDFSILSLKPHSVMSRPGSSR